MSRTDTHRGSHGVAEESLKIQTPSEAKPEVENFVSNKKLTPLLEFWEKFGVKGASFAGANNKGLPNKSYTGGNKANGTKILQTRGTRVLKSKVKSAKKTPIKGKLIQTKINLKPIKLNLNQLERPPTSTDELDDKDNGYVAVDRKLDG